MYVVTVAFKIVPQNVKAFREAVLLQAHNSLQLEGSCAQFDVCFDADEPTLCFLYEKYDDRAAFDEHLASNHFATFEATVASWIESKEVKTWTDENHTQSDLSQTRHSD